MQNSYCEQQQKIVEQFLVSAAFYFGNILQSEKALDSLDEIFKNILLRFQAFTLQNYYGFKTVTFSK